MRADCTQRYDQHSILVDEKCHTLHKASASMHCHWFCQHPSMCICCVSQDSVGGPDPDDRLMHVESFPVVSMQGSSPFVLEPIEESFLWEGNRRSNVRSVSSMRHGSDRHTATDRHIGAGNSSPIQQDSLTRAALVLPDASEIEELLAIVVRTCQQLQASDSTAVGDRLQSCAP